MKIQTYLPQLPLMLFCALQRQLNPPTAHQERVTGQLNYLQSNKTWAMLAETRRCAEVSPQSCGAVGHALSQLSQLVQLGT